MEPGALIASGRDADIFELGDGLVLRRARDGRSLEDEARIMRYVGGHRYPVPEVHEVRAHGSEIVMERIDGPSMADLTTKRPWTMGRHASMLADLHDQLHEIPPARWLRRGPGRGDQVLHLDLHPLNVLMSRSGPVVIDWANAVRGEALLDVAATYVLLTIPRAPGPRAVGIAVQPTRRALARRFIRRYGGRDLDENIAAAAELKVLDRNMSRSEIVALRKLAARMHRRADAGESTA